jgi:hypothetical protein
MRPDKHGSTTSMTATVVLRHAGALLCTALAACATGPLPGAVEFRGASAADAAQRAEILWALQPYAVAASGCEGAITGVDALPGGAPPAHAQGVATRRETWIVYLCATALPVTVTLRTQADGRLDFAFDRAR